MTGQMDRFMQRVTRRPCISCGIPAQHTRCSRCERERDRTRRPSPRDRGYDAAYRRERARLIGQRCELGLPGCTIVATTADHVIPVSQGGAGGHLRPACLHCNSARGNRATATEDRPVEKSRRAATHAPFFLARNVDYGIGPDARTAPQGPADPPAAQSQAVGRRAVGRPLCPKPTPFQPETTVHRGIPRRSRSGPKPGRRRWRTSTWRLTSRACSCWST